MSELASGDYDWENASRRDGMVRFGPIIGYDILLLNEQYQNERENVLAVIRMANNESVFTPLCKIFRDLAHTSLCIVDRRLFVFAGHRPIR